MGAFDQIKDIEDEIRKTKYNKATQHHIGLLKAKLARLKDKAEGSASKGTKTKGYDVKKSGDGTVILVGFPSVGKSTLLNQLTNANSKVGSYAFTTLTVVPGNMEYKGAKIQILDVPGIVKGAAYGRGRGKEVLAVMRSADLALIIVDVNFPEHAAILAEEIYNTNIRMDQIPPDVQIVKASRGGINVLSTKKLTKISHDMIVSILKEFKINNAAIVIRTDITPDELIDVIQRNRVYMPSIVALNKVDDATLSVIRKAEKVIGKKCLHISAKTGLNIAKLREAIFEQLNFIRIYTKEVRKKADLVEPLIIKKGATIRDVCNKLHREFVTKFKFARVFGPSAKFPGQKLSLDHTLLDTDVIEIHLR